LKKYFGTVNNILEEPSHGSTSSGLGIIGLAVNSMYRPISSPRTTPSCLGDIRALTLIDLTGHTLVAKIPFKRLLPVGPEIIQLAFDLPAKLASCM
jgi:hypothetical protein